MGRLDITCVYYVHVQSIDTICGFHEKRLLNDLLRHYNYLERPVINESTPVLLTFGITLQQIIDVVSFLIALAWCCP